MTHHRTATLTAPHPHTRIGDADRNRTGEHLGLALSLGYLTLPEYEQRLDHAVSARTTADLDEALAGLSLTELRRQDQQRLQRRRAAAHRGVTLHLLALLAAAVLMVGIWLVIAIATGAWYPWPVWPVLGGAIGWMSHAIPVRLIVR